MKCEKIFKLGMKEPENFDNEVIESMVNDYNCIKENARVSLTNCLAYGWAICLNKENEAIGIQTNYDRSEVKLGK